MNKTLCVEVRRIEKCMKSNIEKIQHKNKKSIEGFINSEYPKAEKNTIFAKNEIKKFERMRKTWKQLSKALSRIHFLLTKKVSKKKFHITFNLLKNQNERNEKHINGNEIIFFHSKFLDFSFKKEKHFNQKSKVLILSVFYENKRIMAEIKKEKKCVKKWINTCKTENFERKETSRKIVQMISEIFFSKTMTWRVQKNFKKKLLFFHNKLKICLEMFNFGERNFFNQAVIFFEFQFYLSFWNLHFFCWFLKLEWSFLFLSKFENASIF